MSLTISLLAYALVAWREKSWINVLTPSYVISLPSHWLLELYLIHSNGAEYSTFAYIFVYFTYAAVQLTFALAYCFLRTPLQLLRGLNRGQGSYRLFAVFLIFCGWAMYAPILYDFRDMLLSPRLIYMQTRTGYGIWFYGSAILVNLGFVLVLLWKNRPRGLASLAFISCLILALLHGAKGDVMIPLFAAFFFRVYGRSTHKYGLAKLAAYAAAFAVALLLMFAFTLRARQAVEWSGASELLLAIAEYSSYNRNAMTVIDSHLDRQWGRLTLENSVYGVIPRALFPDKPKNFGSFMLAEEFYPKWFYAETGAPDFGIGTQYADFGGFALVYLVGWAVLEGFLLRVSVDRFQKGGLPGDFIMMLFFAGINMLTIPGYMLLEHYLLAMVLNFGLRLRLGVNFALREPDAPLAAD